MSIFNTYKAIQCVPTSAYSSRFIAYASSFIILGKLSLGNTSDNTSVFQYLLKDGVDLKIISIFITSS